MATSIIRSGIKFYYGEYLSSSVSGNSSVTLTPTDLPTTYSEVYALVPLGYTPDTSWATTFIFKGSSSTNIFGQSVGSTSQKYNVRYLVIYR